MDLVVIASHRKVATVDSTTTTTITVDSSSRSFATIMGQNQDTIEITSLHSTANNKDLIATIVAKLHTVVTIGHLLEHHLYN